MGFTLIELLVVLAIMATLFGLIVPAVHQAREASNRAGCQNHIRQLGLATMQARLTYQTLPPGLGWYPGISAPGAYGTLFFHLLPFINQNNLYQQSASGGNHFAKVGNVLSCPIDVYCCPSDPSYGSNGVVRDDAGTLWGASSFAVNAQVFCMVSRSGQFQHGQGRTRLPDDVPDGEANTIFFAEKYAACTDQAYPQGGNYWAYWLTGSNSWPCHPLFAVSWNEHSIGPGSKPLTAPSPFRGNCDPTVASSPHRSGMSAGMGDGSVRFLSSTMSSQTWWSLCTPAGSDTPIVAGED